MVNSSEFVYTNLSKLIVNSCEFVYTNLLKLIIYKHIDILWWDKRGEQNTFGKGLETFSNRHILSFERKSERESQRGQYVLAVDLGCYKWYLVEPDTRRYASLLAVPQRGVDTRWYASKDVGPKGGGFGSGPTSIGERNDCQQGRWSPKGGGL